MQDLVAVDVVQAVHQLLHHLLDLRQGEDDVVVAKQSCQVMLTELEHQVESALVAVGEGCCTMTDSPTMLDGERLTECMQSVKT